MKMNDNEIVTALDCCIAEEVQGCKDCHLLEFSPDYNECQAELMKQALDLINRQQAEISELRKGFTADMDYFASEYDSQIKSEACKEFAERLKEKRCGGTYPYVLLNDIDNLLAVMESGRG